MKTQLKDDIWIEGFGKLSEVYAFKDNMCIVGEAVPYIYIGKTSEISEVLAKECVHVGVLTDNCKDYQSGFNIFEQLKNLFDQLAHKNIV